jgi:hypothetical protein
MSVGIGGLVTLHRYGPGWFSELARRSRSAYAYGDSEAAKRQRMRDLRAKREFVKRYGPDEGLRRWLAMVERHRQAFGGKSATAGRRTPAVADKEVW